MKLCNWLRFDLIFAPIDVSTVYIVMNVNEYQTKYIISVKCFDPFESCSSMHPIKYYINIYIHEGKYLHNTDQVCTWKRLKCVETSPAFEVFCLIFILTFITIIRLKHQWVQKRSPIKLNSYWVSTTPLWFNDRDCLASFFPWVFWFVYGTMLNSSICAKQSPN